MNNRMGPQASGVKRKFPGDGPTDPRVNAGQSRPPVRHENMPAGPPFPGRGGPPSFQPGRGAPFADRQGPPQGRGRGGGGGPPPPHMMRGGRGPMNMHPGPHGGPGPRSGDRGPPMRGENYPMGQGAPGQMQRGPPFNHHPPPPMQHHQHPPNHNGPRGGPMGPLGGRGQFVPPPPPPPMHQVRHNMPPQAQQGYHPPGPRPPPHQHQPSGPPYQHQPSGPPPPHMQNRGPQPPHHASFGHAPNAPPQFVPQGFPQQSTGMPMPPRQQQNWSQYPPQQSSGFQGAPAGNVGNIQPLLHHQNQNANVPPQHQATQQSAIPAAATSYTTEQIDQAWSEHKGPDGVSYFFNSLKNESTYQKPAALEKNVPGQAISTHAQPVTKPIERVWVEYTDASTGKKYYSDGQTTTWSKPEGFAGGAVSDPPTKKVIAAEAKIVESEDAGTSDNATTTKKKKRANKKESPFASKAEATAAFKGLLLAKGIAPILKWHEVVKLCSSDTRWDDCEDALTLGERKQALAEYQTKRANELRTMERQERIRAKEAFQQLLTAVLPSLPAFHASSSKFSDIRDALSKDDRFYAVQDEDTRESLFLDFCEEVRKRDDRNRNNKKRECKDAFLAFLREKEEQGLLSFASTWSSFIAALSDEDTSDTRFLVSSAMSDSDRQVYFADFVIELQAAEDDKRRRIRDARKRAEKAQREAFRDALRSMALDGILLPSTRWRTVEDMISTHATYAPVHDQDRELPREIFEDFLEEWNELYRRDRVILTGLVHPASNRDIVVTATTTFDDFTKALLQEASFSPELHADTRHIINHNDPISSARVYFNELVAKAKENSSSLPRARRSSILRNESEDEGEIVEEGEVTELDAIDDPKQVDNRPLSEAEPSGDVNEKENPTGDAINADLAEGPA